MTAPSGVGRNGRTVSALGLRALAVAGFAGAAWLFAGAAAQADGAAEPAPPGLTDLPVFALIRGGDGTAAPDQPGPQHGRAGLLDVLPLLGATGPAGAAGAAGAAVPRADEAPHVEVPGDAAPAPAQDVVAAVLAPAADVLRSVTTLVAEPVAVPDAGDRTAAVPPAAGSLLDGVGHLVTWATGTGKLDAGASAPPATAMPGTSAGTLAWDGLAWNGLAGDGLVADGLAGTAIDAARTDGGAPAVRRAQLTSTDRTGAADAAGAGGHMHRAGATRTGGPGSDEEPTRMPGRIPLWVLPGAGSGAPTTASGAHGDGGIAAVIPVSAAGGAAQARPLPPGAEVAVLRMRAQDRTFSPD